MTTLLQIITLSGKIPILLYKQPSGGLLRESVKDLKHAFFSNSYQKINIATREKLDEWLFDKTDKEGINKEKANTPLMKLFAKNFKKFWDARVGAAKQKLVKINSNANYINFIGSSI